MQLTRARCARQAITRTEAFGSERMSRMLGDALPSGDTTLRSALWTLLRPMLSPRLADLHRDTFIDDATTASSVDLDAHRGDSSLAELDLGPDLNL
jgi:hypothetical protein